MPAGSEAAAGVAPALGVLSGCSWLSPKSETFAVKPRRSSCEGHSFLGIIRALPDIWQVLPGDWQ